MGNPCSSHNMTPYPAYKDSGISWLGQIPAHWDVKSLKRLSSLTLGKMLTPQDKGEYVRKPYLRAKNVLWEKVDITDIKEMWFSEQELTQYRLKLHDLLLCEGGEVGRTAIWKEELEECYIQNSVHKVTIHQNYTPDYFLYLFLLYGKRGHFDAIVDRVSIAHLTKEKLKEVSCLVPPLSEQRAIAAFLDHKTRQIDTYIAKKQQQIERWQAYRSALINQAVTKGLNPDVPMKESGIEWLGEIPAHWDVKKLKQICYMKGRIGWQGLKQAEFTDKGPYLITGMNFKDGVIRWDEVYHITEERYNEAPEIQLKIGDVLMTKDGTIGKLLYVDTLPGKASLNSHLLVLRPLDNEFLPKYLYYQLQSEFFKYHIEIHKTGTTFFGITQEAVGLYKMLLPPLKEQQTIAQFIDTETVKIDALVATTQQQIDRLRAYRTSLISDAVTGKIDVRDYNYKDFTKERDLKNVEDPET